MSEKPIGSMSRQELFDRLNEIMTKSNEVEKLFSEIKKQQTEFKQSHMLAINEIHQARAQSVNASKEIDSMKSNLQKSNDKIKISATDDFNKYRGMHKELYDSYEKKYAELYKKKEGELLSEVTTVSLSKEFGEKVEEYNGSRKKWQWWLIFILLVAFFESIYIYGGEIKSLLDDPKSVSIDEISRVLLLKFFAHIPIYSFFVWLVIYIGNRRAENAKLGEIYKHKEVMAKTFFGYKKSIEDLPDDGKKLLVKLMDYLLEAINKDPSNTLSSKGEKPPITDIVKWRKSPSSD